MKPCSFLFLLVVCGHYKGFFFFVRVRGFSAQENPFFFPSLTNTKAIHKHNRLSPPAIIIRCRCFHSGFLGKHARSMRWEIFAWGNWMRGDNSRSLSHYEHETRWRQSSIDFSVKAAFSINKKTRSNESYAGLFWRGKCILRVWWNILNCNARQCLISLIARCIIRTLGFLPMQFSASLIFCTLLIFEFT